MLIDWTDEFDQMLDRLDERVAVGDADAVLTRRLVMLELGMLADLPEAPTEDSKSIKRVRQSKKHVVWRLAHPYVDGKAVRTIVWFPDDQHAVVALFANDKAQMGDVFYDSVGTRADQAIEKFRKDREAEQR